MKYYTVEPEVAGGWGKNTVFDRVSGRPTIVRKLHYEFSGWLGDELLTSTPCFRVSERMESEIARGNFTGACFDEVEITKSGEFQDFYPDRRLPKFVWLRVDGNPGHHDFGLARGIRLVVSERALKVLQDVGISHASIGVFFG